MILAQHGIDTEDGSASGGSPEGLPPAEAGSGGSAPIRTTR